MPKHADREEQEGEELEQEAKAELREPAQDDSGTTSTAAGPRPPNGPPSH